MKPPSSSTAQEFTNTTTAVRERLGLDHSISSQDSTQQHSTAPTAPSPATSIRSPTILASGGKRCLTLRLSTKHPLEHDRLGTTSRSHGSGGPDAVRVSLPRADDALEVCEKDHRDRYRDHEVDAILTAYASAVIYAVFEAEARNIVATRAAHPGTDKHLASFVTAAKRLMRSIKIGELAGTAAFFDVTRSGSRTRSMTNRNWPGTRSAAPPRCCPRRRRRIGFSNQQSHLHRAR